MSKVLLLNGSPRPEGNTDYALKECAKAIEAAGVSTEIISLAGKKIESCTACMSCFATHKCALDDGLNEIIDKIKEADGFIVGAPVYFGTPRGDVMSALQRIGYVNGSYYYQKPDPGNVTSALQRTDYVNFGSGFLSRKVGGPISIAASEGTISANQDMLVFFLAANMFVPGTYPVSGGKGREPGDVIKDERGLASIRNFGENVAYLINLMKKT